MWFAIDNTGAVVETFCNDPGDDIYAMIAARHAGKDITRLTSHADHLAYMAWLNTMDGGDPPAKLGNKAVVSIAGNCVSLQDPSDVEQSTLAIELVTA